MLPEKQRYSSVTTRAIILTIILIFPGSCSAATASATATAASPVKTVVVLVMENRSFDHMLGWMKKLNPEIDGVDGTESNPVSTTDPNSARVYFGDKSHFVDPDPGHSFQAIREQIFGSNDTSTVPPPMNGFAQQARSMDPNMTESVMNGFLPDKVGVYKALVSEFAVFDRWFASVPASTQPNRLYVHSGTSHGATSNIASLLIKGYPQRTIFEDLDDAGYSFGIYFQNIPATLFYKNLRKLKYLGNFHPYGLSFKNDAKNGKLPNYVVVEQRYVDSKIEPANDDHPSHDVYEGQLFVKEVYEILRSSPQWNETLFVITYDEHGGFFDHVPTPVSGVPSPDGIVGPDPFFFRFDRLGVRVPTIAVSPWIQKGTVVHGPKGSPYPTSEYEHSSIPATVRKIFNLPSPSLTKREQWAGTFESILHTLKFPRTDCPEKLPTPIKIRQGEANEDAQLTEFQQEMVQLAAVLKGEDILATYPEQIGKGMTVKEGKRYMEDAVKSFFEAGNSAKRMGVDEDQIVKMRPSLTTRRSKPTPEYHP
ncbi:OLC1v1005389C1 [Oldenlandia corymbosa var. corymbosa]|uniref:OLC1v1005389C1 n=1 Tax=Oldenlandia corymbosa var. corymbosa TaxID=529605 RepID=A0AAV1DF09_OLDCO|nr:OLC1v1005389C1 [Oldenlandia corymbosa var. corymbosa]